MESYTYRELDDMIKERTKGMSIAERVNFKLGAEWWFEISNYKLPNRYELSKDEENKIRKSQYNRLTKNK